MPFCGVLRRPSTQLIRRQTPAARQHRARPCYLILHLTMRATPGYAFPSVSVATWSALNDPRAFLPSPNPFSSLSNVHLKFPLSAPRSRDPSLSGARDQKEFTVAISERDIAFSAGASRGAGRTVVINHIHTVMGDVFLGTINGGINGGSNNVNSFGAYWIASWSFLSYVCSV